MATDKLTDVTIRNAKPGPKPVRLADGAGLYLEVGDFIWTGGDCHIYSNHAEQVELQLARAPLPYPTLAIKRRPASIFDYEFEDFEVIGYEHHPAIRAPVAV